MNYDVVCEVCNHSVLKAPHLGDPEAARMAAHLREHHHLGATGRSDRDAFAEMLKQFRVRMAE
jgi:hypothetical protein